MTWGLSMSQLESKPPEDTQPAPEAIRVRILLGVAVFVSALIVRLVYAAQAWSCPMFQYPTIDAGVYYLLARDFAQGAWMYPPGEPYWQPPFYSFVLAIWMKIAGESVSGMKYAQFVLGSANCALIYALGARLFGGRVGLIAGVMAVFYAPLMYFDGELLTPTLQIFLNLCAFLLLRAVERPSLPMLALAGLVMGFSVITRPDVAVFVVAAAAWVFVTVRSRLPRATAVKAAAVVILCALVPVAPVAVRNYVQSQDFVPISYNGGLNFYIGNNAHYDETLAIRPGPEWDALVAMPLKENPNATPSQQSAYFYRAGFDYILSHPADWLLLTLRKSAAFFTAIEVRRNHDMYFLGGYSSLFSVLLFRVGGFAFPFGVVLPLAVVGLLTRPRNRDTALMLVYVAAQLAVTVAFFVVDRYRVTAIPVLIVFAAFGVIELWRMIRTRRPAPVVLLAATVVFIFSNANVPGVDRDRRLVDADSHYFVAGILDGDGKRLEAIPEYERAIRLNPRFYLSRLNYGRLLFGMERWNDAIRQLKEAVQISWDYPEAHWLLGESYDRLNEGERALRHYKAAVSMDAIYAEGLAHAGVRAFENGSYDYSVRIFLIVVEAKPDYPQALHTLGLGLVQLQRYEEAIETLRQTCEMAPDSSESWLALGIAYHQAGKLTESRSAFDRAIELDPAGQTRERIQRYLSRH